MIYLLTERNYAAPRRTIMEKNLKLRQEKDNVFYFIPSGEYYFNRGLKAYERHQNIKAKKYFIRAKELDPFEPAIYCHLSMVHTELGEYELANQLLHQVLDEIDNEMVQCHYLLANNYVQLGMFTSAYKHVKLYLDLDETGAFAEEADILLEMIEMNEGEEIDLFYEDDETMMRQDEAREYLEAGDFNKAIKILKEVVAVHPEYWSAYNNLALAYFYLGKIDKAAEILEDVLEKNPGNFHGLCNLAVFLYYQQEEAELMKVIAGLEKVQPIYFEHRYKLGATFALVGHDEKAYYWLKKLEKQGYQGDPGYYYWLAQTSYRTGRMQNAKKAWKMLVELNPEKAGLEPWNKHNENDKDTDPLASIWKYLKSGQIAERLFGIFLLSLTKAEQKQKIIAHPDFPLFIDHFILEHFYKTNVLLASEDDSADQGIFQRSYTVALELLKKHSPIEPIKDALLITWFTVFIHAYDKERLSNPVAIAAAIEYVWYKTEGERKTQKDIAAKYQISLSTLQKYVKWVISYYPEERG